ncbi:unnamed protein product [Staurois parvus]|uniref:Uncharacterized protein n=1 Tax=Staurois parvus TaxID=386267 RepID=A0ABN9C6Z2_9NEOB|nr:unnamed protein product [Staurois parvus]
MTKAFPKQSNSSAKKLLRPELHQFKHFPCLCALPGSAQHRDPVPAVSSGHSGTPIVERDLCMKSRSCDH